MKKLINIIENKFNFSHLLSEKDFNVYCQRMNLNMGKTLLIITIIIELLICIPFLVRYNFDFKILIGKFYIKMYMAMILLSLVGFILSNVLDKRIKRYDKKVDIILDIFYVLIIIWGIGISYKDLKSGGTSIVYMEMLLYTAVFFYIKFRESIIIYFFTNVIYIIMLNSTGIRAGRIYGEVLNSLIIVFMAIAISYKKYLFRFTTYNDLKLIEEKNKELNSTNEKLYKMSILDPLTHLYNKQKLGEICIHEYEKALNSGIGIVYIMIDIDHYKKFNDRYGHVAGDECLKNISEKLYLTVSKYNGYIGRYGGEEFLAVLSNINCIAIEDILKEIVNEIENMQIRNESSEVSEYVTISAGAYKGIPTKGECLSKFIELADKSLYMAKEQGRNRYVINNKETLQIK